jgi:hypothetical protein
MKNRHLEGWVKNAFDAWRYFKKLDPCMSIEDFFEIGLKFLVQWFSKTILQVLKKNEKLCPPTRLV